MNIQSINQENKLYTLYTQLLNGTVTVVALILISILIMNPERITDPNWVIWFLVIIGGLHTFEEYTYPGRFTQWINVGHFNRPQEDFPLSPKKAFFIDAMAGVVIIAMLAVLGTNFLWLTLGLTCVFFINGSWHLTSAITTGVYSPGAVTAALFNLPLGAYIVYFYFSQGYATLWDVLIAYGIGLFVHILFFASLRRDIKNQGTD